MPFTSQQLIKTPFLGNHMHSNSFFIQDSPLITCFLWKQKHFAKWNEKNSRSELNKKLLRRRVCNYMLCFIEKNSWVHAKKKNNWTVWNNFFHLVLSVEIPVVEKIGLFFRHRSAVTLSTIVDSARSTQHSINLIDEALFWLSFRLKDFPANV